MVRKFAIAGIACLMLSSALAAPKGLIEIRNGFMDGNDYLRLSQYERRLYAMGFLNGLLLAPLAGAPKIEVQWFERCTSGMNDNQVASIITKWLQENPARWHEGLHLSSWNALKNACQP